MLPSTMPVEIAFRKISRDEVIPRYLAGPIAEANSPAQRLDSEKEKNYEALRAALYGVMRLPDFSSSGERMTCLPGSRNWLMSLPLTFWT